MTNAEKVTSFAGANDLGIGLALISSTFANYGQPVGVRFAIMAGLFFLIRDIPLIEQNNTYWK